MNRAVMLNWIMWFFLELASSFAVQGQNVFQDLDFESAVLSPAPAGQFPSLVAINAALPGWTGYLGTEQQTQVEYNVRTLGAANIAVLGPTWSTSDPGVIDGNYGVLLQAGAVPDGYTGNASIEQTGTIPANAESMQFKCWENGNLSDLGISFSGNSLTPFLTSSGSTYNTYSVNIEPYAGQTGVLEFSAIFDSQGATWINLDDIAFSPNAVPEPNTLALILMGGLALAARRWRSKGS